MDFMGRVRRGGVALIGALYGLTDDAVIGSCYNGGVVRCTPVPSRASAATVADATVAGFQR